MKNIHIYIIGLLLSISLLACSSDESIVGSSGFDDSSQAKQIEDAISELPSESISEAEEEGLIHMREEEKLARDVYLHFYDKYGMRIFNNIASSENTHLYAIKVLLYRYGIPDPVVNDEVGVFTIQAMQDLYDQLTAAGDVSLVEALKVGTTIEDLDIKDLMDFDAEVDNQDIKFTYANLTRGSRNHLRAYYPKVLDNGGTYSAQFISQELFDSIINSSRERGSWK